MLWDAVPSPRILGIEIATDSQVSYGQYTCTFMNLCKIGSIISFIFIYVSFRARMVQLQQASLAKRRLQKLGK